MEETIERIVSFFRHASQGLEERKQILYLLGPVGGGKSSLAERLKALMEHHPIYVLKAGNEISPVFESPLGLFDPEQNGAMIEERYGIPRRRLTGLMSPWCIKRLDEFRGDISKFKVVKIHALAPAPDRHLQDRAGRREQPGHLLARRQGRHPQAGDAVAGRSRRLQLLGRPQPRQPGHARVRRDVQGAHQDAAPPAHRDAGGQLRRHGEHRRDPVHRHHHGPFQRVGMADLPLQQEQRSLHRPHLRDQGALLPPRDGGGAHLRQADPDVRADGGALRARHAGDAGALLRAVAPARARELQPLLQDARLRRREPARGRSPRPLHAGVQGRRRRRRGHGRHLHPLRLQGAGRDLQPRHGRGRRRPRAPHVRAGTVDQARAARRRRRRSAISSSSRPSSRPATPNSSATRSRRPISNPIRTTGRTCSTATSPTPTPGSRIRTSRIPTPASCSTAS